MEILVVYHSRTKNTQYLAEEVAAGVDEVPGCRSNLKTVAQVSQEDFLNAAGVIAGSPVYFGSMAAELKKVFDDFIPLRRRMENKIGAAFSSSGHHSGGKETTLMSILQALLIYGMIIVGDPMSASGHYGAACSGRIDEATRDQARKLGQRVARLALASRSLRETV